MPSQSLLSSSANVLPSRGNQSSSGLSFLDDEMTFCTLLQYGVFILEEYQEQAFLYTSAVADMIDIKDGANAHCWSSSSFQHKNVCWVILWALVGFRHCVMMIARILIWVLIVSQIFAKPTSRIEMHCSLGDGLSDGGGTVT
jgi:hypothetical protein